MRLTNPLGPKPCIQRSRIVAVDQVNAIDGDNFRPSAEAGLVRRRTALDQCDDQFSWRRRADQGVFGTVVCRYAFVALCLIVGGISSEVESILWVARGRVLGGFKQLKIISNPSLRGGIQCRIDIDYFVVPQVAFVRPGPKPVALFFKVAESVREALASGISARIAAGILKDAGGLKNPGVEIRAIVLSRCWTAGCIAAWA